MTNREYIQEKVKPFELSEAYMADIEASTNISMDDIFVQPNVKTLMLSVIDCLEEMILKPRVESINESGFSIHWDYKDLGKFYMFLCRKYGRKPSDAILDLLGISSIIDRTSIW